MQSMEMLHITDENQLQEVVQKVLVKLEIAQKADSPSVLALSGDLGSGKTTFTKILASELGIDEVVTSPTFVIMKRYEISGEEKALKIAKQFSELFHLDAYRIEDIDEMRVLGFEEILKKPEALICIEWAERIKELLPPQTVSLQFEREGETGRKITFL